MILGGHFDLDTKKERIKEIDELMLGTSFWNDSETANKLIMEVKKLKDIVNNVESIYNDIKGNLELMEETSDYEILFLAENELDYLKSIVDKLELEIYLSGEYDETNAIIEIHAGAGGTESCDWANMLYRMYMRYATSNGFKLEELDRQDGDEAGIKSVMFKINGSMAYGYLKGEKGVHRLVRISPFDSNNRRHTSFASVDVMPEIDKNIDVEINDNDLRVDIYRSSGPGGQGVNTTDSAVRITHIPTGIVVTCQNERSQIRNKEKALEVLKNKLYVLELEKQNNKISDIKGEQLSNGWGSAKRSYVMCPYTMVKDSDSGYETSSVDKILDGEIEEMLVANLKVGG